MKKNPDKDEMIAMQEMAAQRSKLIAEGRLCVRLPSSSFPNLPETSTAVLPAVLRGAVSTRFAFAYLHLALASSPSAAGLFSTEAGELRLMLGRRRVLCSLFLNAGYIQVSSWEGTTGTVRQWRVADGRMPGLLFLEAETMAKELVAFTVGSRTCQPCLASGSVAQVP